MAHGQGNCPDALKDAVWIALGAVAGSAREDAATIEAEVGLELRMGEGVAPDVEGG